MLLGALFLVGVVLLALGLRWISSHNDPVYKNKTGGDSSSAAATQGVKPTDKKDNK
jgi:hypothetical protein